MLPAPSSPPDGIDIDEIRDQCPYVTAVLESPDTAARRVAVAEGFMTFGPRFIFLLGQALDWARHSQADPETSAGVTAGTARADEAIADLDAIDVWCLDWLKGERFTERADEPERRAGSAPDALLRSFKVHEPNGENRMPASRQYASTRHPMSDLMPS